MEERRMIEISVEEYAELIRENERARQSAERLETIKNLVDNSDNSYIDRDSIYLVLGIIPEDK